MGSKKTEILSTELAANPSGRVLIDIRRPDEWHSTGIIDGCHRLTFYDAQGNADVATWMTELAKIATPEDEIILICRSGRRTAIILDFLLSQTPYHRAGHLVDGMLGWLGNQLPVVVVNDLI